MGDSLSRPGSLNEKSIQKFDINSKDNFWDQQTLRRPVGFIPLYIFSPRFQQQKLTEKLEPGKDTSQPQDYRINQQDLKSSPVDASSTDLPAGHPAVSSDQLMALLDSNLQNNYSEDPSTSKQRKEQNVREPKTVEKAEPFQFPAGGSPAELPTKKEDVNVILRELARDMLLPDPSMMNSNLQLSSSSMEPPRALPDRQ